MSTPSLEQTSEIRRAIRRGLRALEKPEPLRLSEWAAENFYLSAESSYVEGTWEAIPYQNALMDCMSNDDVRSITFMKSARVGYTKMIVAAIGYFAEHKRRNQLVYQPVDDDADDFVKDEIDPMLRDVPAVQRVFPYYNSKSKHNTLSKKSFIGSTLDIRGGKAGKNYRRMSKDVVYYDELDGFDEDIENEGDAVTLGDKRVEGATFPKSIRGSTPKIKGQSQIEKCFDRADQRFRYHVPCPHCGELHDLKWGGPDASFGFKWANDDPSTVGYLCPHCACLYTYEQYVQSGLPVGRWVSDDGIWIDADGYFHAEDGEIIQAPEHLAFHIWTAYSVMVTWEQIVKEFKAAQKDRSKLKTFVNTTLGETWEEDEGDRTDAHTLMLRREPYTGVPDGVIAIFASVDTQDDRFEIQYDGYGVGEERWSLRYRRIYGDPSRPGVWDKLEEELLRTFTKDDGTILQVALAVQDHGGHYSDEVNKFSKRMGVHFLIPVKGSSTPNRPVATFPRKRNANGVYLTEVGTDTAKSLLYQRYGIADPGPGYVHWPISEEFDRTYFDQVTAEKRVRRYKNGRPIYVWDAGKKRNEATDVSVYSLAAVRIAQQNFGLRLVAPESTPPDPAPAKKRGPARRTVRSKYLRN